MLCAWAIWVRMQVYNSCSLINLILLLGGPLLVNGVQVGVASFRNGPTCEGVDGKYPNVYTDVSYFIEWIENQTGIDYQLNVFLQRKA